MITDKQLYILLGAAVLAVWYTQRQAETLVEEVADSINPVNPDNIFNSGVNALGRSITGDKHWTLGGAIHEAIHD